MDGGTKSKGKELESKQPEELERAVSPVFLYLRRLRDLGVTAGEGRRGGQEIRERRASKLEAIRPMLCSFSDTNDRHGVLIILLVSQE